MAFKLKSGNKPSFKMMGSKPYKRALVGDQHELPGHLKQEILNAPPLKQEKKGDEFGSIEKGQYPNLVQDISEVQKDDIGHFVTGLDDGTGPHYSSDTTRFPANFTTWQGPIKEGDLLDETAHEAWMGVDVETENPDGSNPATGQRMMYDEESGTYKPFKQKEAAKVAGKAALQGAKKLGHNTVKKEIEKMLGGGATDSEIRKYVKSTGTGDKYEYNWDNVTQRVEAHPLQQKTKTEYSGVDGKRGKYKKGFYEKETKRGAKGTAVTIHEGSDEARLERYGPGRKRKKDKVISKKRAERIMRRKGKSHKQAD